MHIFTVFIPLLFCTIVRRNCCIGEILGDIKTVNYPVGNHVNFLWENLQFWCKFLNAMGCSHVNLKKLHLGIIPSKNSLDCPNSQSWVANGVLRLYFILSNKLVSHSTKITLAQKWYVWRNFWILYKNIQHRPWLH